MTATLCVLTAGDVTLDAEIACGHVDEAVRSAVDLTLIALRDAEADRLCGAADNG